MIIVSDFDNTLYPHGDEKVFIKNLKSVTNFRKSPDNHFVLATGRSLSSIRRVFPEYKKYMDYIILDNGSMCLDAATDKPLFEYKISKEIAKKIMNLIDSMSIVSTAVYYFDFIEHRELSQDVTKLRFWTHDKMAASKIVNVVNQKYSEHARAYLATGVVPSTISWIDGQDFSAFVDIVPSEAGKENMIRKLQLQYYPHDNIIITVGDSYNDIDMLKQFDGYVVAGADVKAIEAVPKDHIIGSVDELIRRVS